MATDQTRNEASGNSGPRSIRGPFRGAREKRRLQKLTERVDAAFAAGELTGDTLAQAAREYLDALRLALGSNLDVAVRLYRDYNARIPAPLCRFTADDRDRLAEAAAQYRSDVLGMVLDIASRVPLPDVQRRARDQLTLLLCDPADANGLVAHLARCDELALLDAKTLADALGAYARRERLDHDRAVWRSFLAGLPPQILPDRFDVHHLLGHGADAARLCRTGAERDLALECCLASPDLADARAGLDLARRAPGQGQLAAHARHVGDLLFEAGQYAEALALYAGEAALPERVSQCHERLGQPFEAIVTCPPSRHGRLAGLVAQWAPEVASLIDRQEFTTAAARLREVATRLALAEAEPVAPTGETAASSGQADELAGCRNDIADRRMGLLRQARLTYRRRAAEQDDAAVYREWSRFEEAAGEVSFAARRAEDGGEIYRAVELYKTAELFGDVIRVTKGDDSPEGLLARAEAYEAGGDLPGAARAFEQCGQGSRAAALYMAAEDFASAAGCLMRELGDEAIEDPRLGDCLIRMRDYDTLTRLSVAAAQARGNGSQGAQHLRSLAARNLVPALRAEEVRAVLEALDGRGRQRFEERAPAWVAQARAEVDRRFSGIWGMDLGTSTCVVAVYDTERSDAVVCPWKADNPLLPSTVSVDRDGNEVVGLAGEDSLRPGLIGRIVGAKRKMGLLGAAYKIRDRAYRPEEVAARLIRQARGQVEDYLRAHVRGRLGELAQAELGEVREEWLAWAEENHELRLERPRAIVTIPARFSNNQKHATRTACKIAQVDLVRLIHEPTAACIEASRQRNLSGGVLVVDLGGGTLDFSVIDVMDGVFEVQAADGDPNLGSRDFDQAIVGALRTRLADQGITVQARSSAERRLEVAAERLKIDLSSRAHAEYVLRGLAGGSGDVTVELDRDELADILRDPMARLRANCARFRESRQYGAPQRMVLIGAPMLSPMVREVFEDAFGLRGTLTRDPRLAVACGAAVQGAVLNGKCHDIVLLDITPLSLGIRIKDGQTEEEEYAELIPAHTPIPTKAVRNDFTTAEDNQSKVRIEIFNGSLDAEAKIGHFLLEGILPGAKDKRPQIEVTFDIDASCVLEVTAKDLGSGQSESVRLEDTTLLSPAEVSRLEKRFAEQRRQEEARQARNAERDLASARVDRLAAAAEDCEAALREFRQRKELFRPGAGPLDDDTERALADLFSREHEIEADVRAAVHPVPDLVNQGHAALDGADPADLGGILRRLDAQAGLIAEATATLASWNRALIVAAMASADPLTLFRSHHDSGDYHAAAALLGRLPDPVADIADVRRQLRCLAETRDQDRYAAVLAANAARLRALTAPPSSPEFANLAGNALVRVRAVRSDGSRVTGTGFLAQESVVVTSGHWLADPGSAGSAVPAASVQVAGAGEATWTASVAEVRVMGRGSGDVVALRLSRPAEPAPLRLGFSALVRVGDAGWILSPGPDGAGATVSRGLIQRFLPFPESGISVFKVAADLPGDAVGGPLFNGLGEVVGVLTSARPQETPAAAFAVTADSLSSLLAVPGTGRLWPGQPGISRPARPSG